MLHIHELGMQPYLPVFEKMKAFTQTRDAFTPDTLWLLEHPPVYTQGQAGKPEHLLQQTEIPVVQSDRGGQITYHGPGQFVAYCLIDLKRKNLGVRTLVHKLEQTLICLLSELDIEATRRCKAPGIYIQNQKIASIGLRVKQGCTYHGIALNVDMDLTPFKAINPCGFEQLSMTQVKSFCPDIKLTVIRDLWIKHFFLEFGY